MKPSFEDWRTDRWPLIEQRMKGAIAWHGCGIRRIRGEVYLHRSCVPLDKADLSTAADHGQLDLWPIECEGMCGV